MRLVELMLKNWCQAQNRVIHFSPGLNAFIGANGAGKSNAVNAIVFALTGEYGRNDGDKASNICQHAGPKEHAYVRLTFMVQNNVKCVVTRGLRGLQTTLKVYRDDVEIESIKGDIKTTTRIQELIGTNTNLLNSYVFVAQGQMFAPFNPNIRPAERMVAFQRLFNLDVMESVWDVLGESLSAIPTIPDVDITESQRLYDDVAAKLVTTQTEYAKYQDLQGWQLELDPNYLLIGVYTQGVQTRTQFITAKEAFRAAMASYKDVRAGHQNFQNAITAVEQLQPQLAQEAQEAQVTLNEAAEWGRYTETLACEQASYDEQASKHATAQTAYTVAKANLDALQIDHSALQAESIQLNANLISDQQAYNLLSGVVGAPTCPTCMQPIGPECAEHVNTLSERITDAKSRLAELQGTLTRYQALKVTLSSAELSLMSVSAVLDAARMRVCSCTQTAPQYPQPTSEAVAAAQQAVSTYQVFCEKFAEKRQQLLKSQQVVDLGRQKAVQYAQTYLQLRRQRIVVPDEAVYQQATHTLQVTRDRVQAMRALEVEHNALNAQYQVYALNLSHNRQLMKDQAVNTQLRKFLTDLRAQFHREALPARIMQQRLLELKRDTNEILNTFGASFHIDVDGVNYKAIFNDGRVMPLARLSGGLQVLTALAFRIATNARFACDLGLLCLDEPTVYLDQDNIKCLEPALACLREFSNMKGLQCIIITHESIGHLFDHVETF